MIALASILRTGDVGVEYPSLLEGAMLPVPRHDDGARVIAATHDQTRMPTIEIGHSAQEAIDAVTVVVAPRFHRTASGNVIDGRQCLASGTFEHRQKLRAAEH